MGKHQELKLSISVPVSKDRKLFFFLLALPVINAVADSTIYYFVEISRTGGLHPGLIRGGIMLLFLLSFGINRLQRNRTNILILFFLGYLFVLTLLSSNVRFSFLTGYIKWFVPLMMFPVGLWFFREFEAFLLLMKIFVISAGFICLNLIVAQVTNFGFSAYIEQSFYSGGAGVGITNQLALVLLMYPIFFRHHSKISGSIRTLIYIVGIVSLILLLVAMKRSGIFSLLLGTLVYLSFTQSRIIFLRSVFVVLIAFYSLFPIIETVFKPRYDARVEQMEDFESEARYQEFFFVLREFREGGLTQKLFGKELFNTGETFGRKYFKRDRMIHSDFNSFFYGAGLIGLLLYLSLYASFAAMGFRYRRALQSLPLARELFAVYFAVLAATLLISATGSGTIGERALVFLFLGGVIGVAQGMVRTGQQNLTE